MAIREDDDPDLYARIEERNLLRQYDLLANCIEIGLHKGIDAFDKYTLWSLNAAATANVAQFGGRWRQQPVRVGSHRPPHFEKVSEMMDQAISLIHENWSKVDHPTHLAAFILWRLNWIHPFVEGNGRTARAACYYLLCLKFGALLPGTKTVPERIRDDRLPYYGALRAADAKWEQGILDVSDLAIYLQTHLTAQISENGTQ